MSYAVTFRPDRSIRVETFFIDSGQAWEFDSNGTLTDSIE